MYIGIDLEVKYEVNKIRGDHYETGKLLTSSAEINKLIKELEDIASRDFVSAHVTHKKTNVDKDVHTKQELLDELYRWMLYNPLA